MSKMYAKVIEENNSIVGSRVELSNGFTTLAGRVSSESLNEFLVDWEDGASSVENKSDYELVVASTEKLAFGPCQRCSKDAIPGSKYCSECQFMVNHEDDQRSLLVRGLPGSEDFKSIKQVPASVESHKAGQHVHVKDSKGQDQVITPPWLDMPDPDRRPNKVREFAERLVDKIKRDPATASVTAAENPAQPAGWAVAPVDANAYPNGELIQEQIDKRRETAEWTDAQNRAPIDGENPAQPAGYAVPPASGEPIPGQGADGLMMAATVYAADISGENGLVELENEDLRMIGKVLAASDDEFLVHWQDSTRTVENKSDYNLILNDDINFDPTVEK